jgi:hypothetical protein
MQIKWNEWNDKANRLVRRNVFVASQWLGRMQKWIVFALISLLTFTFAVMLLQQVIRNVTTPYEERETQWRAQAARASAFADSVELVAATRQARIDKLEKDVVILKGRLPRYDLTDSLRNRVDSLFHTMSDSVLMAYRIIPEQRVVILRQDTTIRVQRVIIAKQDTTIGEQKLTILGYKDAKDSLVAVIKGMPGPPPPVKILGFIPAPSRRTSLLMGLAAGAIMTAQVSR